MSNTQNASGDTRVDVVAFLKGQHDEVEDLINRVQATTGSDRKEAFQCLVRLLAVHETAEEEIVHPMVRNAEGGGAIVNSRLQEEADAKKALAALEKLDVATPEFVHEFNKVADAVKDHAEHEEHEEFPLIEASEGQAARERLTTMVQVAERTAPTHPHPHAPESAGGNLIVGPFAAIADRVRDHLHAKQ